MSNNRWLACFVYHVLWPCASCTACKHAVMLQTRQPHRQLVWDFSKLGWVTGRDICCCDQVVPHSCHTSHTTTVMHALTEDLSLQGAKFKPSFATLIFTLLAGAVVAVTSSARQPPNLQILTQAASNNPVWVPLAFEGSWPFDKAVEQALPNMQHDILKVQTFVLCCSRKTLCSSCSVCQVSVVPRQIQN